jgi:RNA polymerase sigma-70 factor (ECF subfamily)
MTAVERELGAHLPALRRYARHLTRDPVLADDMVQDCAARAIERRDQFTPGTSLRAWLFTILRGVVANHRRGLRSRPADAVTTDRDPAWTLASNQEACAELEQVGRALHALSAEHRTVLLLVHVHGYSYAETAEHLCVPLGTVRSRLARARVELNGRLAEPTGPPNGVESRAAAR